MQELTQQLLHPAGPVLTPDVFEAFGTFITAELGIKMPASKRVMLQSRLQKRLRHLDLNSFEDYYAYVFENPGSNQEIIHLLDAVTTNKTEFFRESRHFEILAQTVLPDLLQRRGQGLRRPLQVWSAGCSTGAEPYTLAMVLSERVGRVEGLSFQILATDICTRVLEIARKAVYEESDIQPVPEAIKKKYLLRSKDRSRALVRIVRELRERVEFRRLNLMEEDYRMPQRMDVVFCRNVIIYFDRPTQHLVLQRICRSVKEDGFLFVGHSETLNSLDLPLRQIATNVYQVRHEKKKGRFA